MIQKAFIGQERLANQISKLTEEKTRLDGQLSNANFVERAPADKVQELRDAIIALVLATLLYVLFTQVLGLALGPTFASRFGGG